MCIFRYICMYYILVILVSFQKLRRKKVRKFYDYGSATLDKILSINPRDFGTSVECFTADFLQSCSTTVKICIFDDRHNTTY